MIHVFSLKYFHSEHLPPLTTEDQVPPEELFLFGGAVCASPDELWEIKSTPGGIPPIREGGTLCERGVR